MQVKEVRLPQTLDRRSDECFLQKRFKADAAALRVARREHTHPSSAA